MLRCLLLSYLLVNEMWLHLSLSRLWREILQIMLKKLNFWKCMIPLWYFCLLLTTLSMFAAHVAIIELQQSLLDLFWWGGSNFSTGIIPSFQLRRPGSNGHTESHLRLYLLQCWAFCSNMPSTHHGCWITPWFQQPSDSEQALHARASKPRDHQGL